MVGGNQALPTRSINSEVINCFFLRVPGKLESSQTIVFALGPSEMQLFHAVARQELNALPHDKIIRAEFLEPFVGSAVFKKSVLSEAEEDCGGNWARSVLCKDNETEARPDDMLVDVQEKRRRLRRETVTPARLHMKPVKIANGRAIADDDRAHIVAFCFANGPAHRTGEASDQLFGAATQIECVPIKFRG